jgi:hypothetical protein
MRLRNIAAVVALASVVGNAQAELFDRGGGLIYDNDLNITWLQNWRLGGLPQDWSAAMAWADNLTYYDSVRDVTYTDWRLPKGNIYCAGYSSYCAYTELVNLLYTELGGPINNWVVTGGPNANSLLLNQPSGYFWTDTKLAGYPAYYIDFYSGIAWTNSNAYAWAVRDGDVASVAAPVPEPETYAMMLAGLGLLGLARRRKQKLNP